MEETSFARPLNSSSTAADDSKITATSHVLEVKTPSSFLRRTRLISVQPFPFAAAKQAFIQPIKMLRLPIVWYCGIMYGWYQVSALRSATEHRN